MDNQVSEIMLQDYMRLNDKFSGIVSERISESFPEKRAFLLLFQSLLQQEWADYRMKN